MTLYDMLSQGSCDQILIRIAPLGVTSHFFGGVRGSCSEKLGVLGGFPSGKFFKITPSRTPGNSLLQRGINIAVIIGLCAEEES